MSAQSEILFLGSWCTAVCNCAFASPSSIRIQEWLSYLAAQWKHPRDATLASAPLTPHGSFSFEDHRLVGSLICSLPIMTDTVSLGDRMKQYETRKQRFLAGN